MNLTRRHFLIGSAALVAGASVSAPSLLPKYHSVHLGINAIHNSCFRKAVTNSLFAMRRSGSLT
jgi:hypothetical protein